MRTSHTALAVLIALAVALPALASMTSPPSTPPPQTPSSTPQAATPTDGARTSGRQQAERLYAEAYEDVAKAKQELEDGKEKNAQKKFKHALKSAEEATRLDDKYFEAWNLVGYAARRLSDYDRALNAYDRCLSIKPDYVPAREYVGEAYLELGNLKKAREQLVWLDRLGATDEHGTLLKLVEAFQAAHPDSATAKPAAAGGE